MEFRASPTLRPISLCKLESVRELVRHRGEKRDTSCEENLKGCQLGRRPQLVGSSSWSFTLQPCRRSQAGRRRSRPRRRRPRRHARSKLQLVEAYLALERKEAARAFRAKGLRMVHRPRAASAG